MKGLTPGEKQGEKQEDPKALKDPQAGTEGLRKSTRARKPKRN